MVLSDIIITANRIPVNVSIWHHFVKMKRMQDMITQISGPQLVSRIFTDTDGRTFRLTFLVAIVAGELKGRLVSVQALSASSCLRGEVCPSVFCLPVSCSENKSHAEFIPAYALIVSPYTELYFFTSQPTRAPSRVS